MRDFTREKSAAVISITAALHVDQSLLLKNGISSFLPKGNAMKSDLLGFPRNRDNTKAIGSVHVSGLERNLMTGEVCLCCFQTALGMAKLAAQLYFRGIGQLNGVIGRVH